MAAEDREWELSFYVVASEEEVRKVYDAIQTILCTCEFPREKDDCRVPVSGMHLHRLDSETGDRIPLSGDAEE